MTGKVLAMKVAALVSPSSQAVRRSASQRLTDASHSPARPESTISISSSPTTVKKADSAAQPATYVPTTGTAGDESSYRAATRSGTLPGTGSK